MIVPELVTTGVICADVMVRPVDALPPRGSLALVPELEMHLGGLAGVTAAVFSQLGGKAAFVGRVGDDSFGDFLLASLEKRGVDTHQVRRDGAHRSSATVVTITEDGERTFMHHMGTNAEVCEDDLDFAFIGQAKLFHWGGPGITPKLEGAAMGRIMERLRAAGVTTSMDTCYDGKGVWLPLIEAVLPHLDIVFSSFEEARHYTGASTAEDMARFFLDRGAGTAVIKLGGDGLLAATAAESHLLSAHQVSVVDTTGAGDAACGGFLYGFARGLSLAECGRLANGVGGLTVQHMGGAEAVHSYKQVLDFMKESPAEG